MNNKHLGHSGLVGLLLLAACGSGGGEDALSGGGPTPPLAGTVSDGTGGDLDMQSSTTTISANWSGFVGNDGPIVRYEWAIGTTAFGTQVQNWTSVGNVATATNTSLTLTVGQTYFVSVQAIDSFGNVSAPACTDGVEITSTGGGGGGGGGGSAGTATNVGQWGITWQFSQPRQVGQFCNGDWWVIGPVTITNISPGAQNSGGRWINGSTVNPSTNCDHGYDSGLFGTYKPEAYKPNLNVGLQLPLTLQPSSSLISTIAQIGPADSGSASQLRTAAVLTVLASVPPADAFRPPYSGTDKTIRHRESELDYGALADLTPASGAPSLTATANGLSRVWLDHCADWVSRYMHPVENMPDYYREFTALLGTAGLLLNCNFTNAQKRDLLVRFTQIGIDHYGNMVNGARWGVNGHCNGRKFPILLAGRVLNDAAMLAVGTTYRTIFNGPGAPGNNKAPFSEDGQTFYVQETSPGVYNWGYGGYTASFVGVPEWGNFHTDNIASDSAVWDLPYRVCCSANGWVGQVLTMRIMGLQPQWNQAAFFGYMDRYIQNTTIGDWQQSWTPWHGTMWHTYRNQF
ncbi:MAG: hypothetical protein JNL08_12295 [Planctomycetes bacterium]|nr:hypothetical protein [Planctomycetota bacterium]